MAATFCALLVHQLLQGPQAYRQFVVGMLAVRGESKDGELAAAVAFIVAVPAAWLVLRWASRAYAGACEPAATLGLQVACAPAALSLVKGILGEVQVEWVILSVALLAWWVVGAGLAAAASRVLPRRHDSELGMHPIPFMLFPVLCGFSAVGVFYFLNRVFLVACPFPVFLPAFGCAGAVLLIASLRAPGTFDWKRALILSQLGIPLLAFAIIPTPIGRPGSLEPAAALLRPMTISALVAVAVMWDILRNASRARPGDTLKIVSPWALLLCVFVLKSPSIDIPVIPADDWHFGEALIPWLSLRDFGLVPFADVMPVRGLVSASELALAQMLYGGNAAEIGYAVPVLVLLLMPVVFASMRYAAGPLAALVGTTVLVDAAPLAYINAFFATGVCVVAGLLARGRLLAACLAWLATIPVIVLVAPGQGALYAVGTSVLAAYAVWNMTRADLARLAAAAIGAGIAVALALVAAPLLGRIAEGIWFYFADNVSINTTGNGVTWSQSFTGRAKPTAAILEAFRSFYLLAAPLAALAGWRLYREARGDGASRAIAQARRAHTEILLCAVVVLTVLLFLPRTLGRIDVNYASRMGAVTWLIVGGLAPLIWARRLKPAEKGAVAIFSILLAYAPADGLRLQPQALLLPHSSYDPAGTIDAGAHGLSNTGSARFDAAHLERLRRLHALLNDMLPPGVPYYDLTNRNAHYAYFARPVPTRWSSAYYLADERAQVRTAADLAARRVPLLLLAPAEALDGVTAALRAYWLYRFVLAEYVAFKRDGYVFAVRRDLADDPRFAGFIRDSGPAVSLFEEAFGMQDLQHVPRAWGLSAAELEKALGKETRAARLSDPADGRILLDAQVGEAELPRFDVLRLAMACAKRGPVRLTWSVRDGETTSTHALTFAAQSGTLLVPVGARPAWTLAPRIAQVSLEYGATPCKVTGAVWMNRVRPGSH